MKHRAANSSSKRDSSLLREPASEARAATNSQLQQLSDTQKRMMKDIESYLKDHEGETTKSKAETEKLITENAEFKWKNDALSTEISRLRAGLKEAEEKIERYERRISE